MLGSLTCTRVEEHEPHKGCVFVASSLGDAHDVSEAASEATR
jgi:hypothetical protein